MEVSVRVHYELNELKHAEDSDTVRAHLLTLETIKINTRPIHDAEI